MHSCNGLWGAAHILSLNTGYGVCERGGRGEKVQPQPAVCVYLKPRGHEPQPATGI